MPPNDDAIQQDKDVSSEQQSQAADTSTTETEKERPKSQREIDMDAMVESRRAQLEADGVKLDASASDTDAQIAAHGADEETATTASATGDTKTAATESDDPRIVTVDGKKMVRTKVNGEESLEPLDKVIMGYQKNNSADKRLEEATRLLEEAKVREAAATTRKEKAEAEEVVRTAAADVDGLKEEFFTSLYGGDQEKARTALDQIINESVDKALKGRDNATSDEALIARVTPAVKQSLAVESALSQFKKDYPKIAQDPYLASRADTFLNEAVAAGKAYDVAFKEAGERTLGWMRDSLGLKSNTTVSTTRTERTERKAAEIDSLPTASAKTVLADAPTEQNVQASIAELRKGRITG